MPHTQTWNQSRTCLALFAHCDDVEVRVGGTLARLVREGRRVVYSVAVENAYHAPHVNPQPTAREKLAVRRAEATRAADVLGVSRTEFMAMKSFYLSKENGDAVYPEFSSAEAVLKQIEGVVFDGLPPILNAYTIPACRDRIKNLILQERPGLILTQSPDDRHPDHYCVARVVTLIVEDLRREGLPVALWYSEPGSGGAMAEYWPNVFVELSREDVAKRASASACFPTQFSDDRSEYTWTRCRAYGRIAGVEFAEAFRAGVQPRMEEGDGEMFRILEKGFPAPQVIRLANPRAS